MYINKRVPLNKFEPTHANLPHLKCAYNDELSKVPHIYWHITGCIILE